MDICLYHILEFVLGDSFLFFFSGLKSEERRDCMIMYWLDIACLIWFNWPSFLFTGWLPECRAAVGVNSSLKFTMLIPCYRTRPSRQAARGSSVVRPMRVLLNTGYQHIRFSGGSVPGVDIPRHGNWHLELSCAVARGQCSSNCRRCGHMYRHSCSLLVVMGSCWMRRGFPRKTCI